MVTIGYITLLLPSTGWHLLFFLLPNRKTGQAICSPPWLLSQIKLTDTTGNFCLYKQMFLFIGYQRCLSKESGHGQPNQFFYFKSESGVVEFHQAWALEPLLTLKTSVVRLVVRVPVTIPWIMELWYEQEYNVRKFFYESLLNLA